MSWYIYWLSLSLLTLRALSARTHNTHFQQLGEPLIASSWQIEIPLISIRTHVINSTLSVHFWSRSRSPIDFPQHEREKLGYRYRRSCAKVGHRPYGCWTCAHTRPARVLKEVSKIKTNDCRDISLPILRRTRRLTERKKDFVVCNL